MVMVNDSELGDYIKSVIDNKGWSLRKAAMKIGVSTAYLSRLTNHKADSEPKPYTLRKLADGLGIGYSKIEEIMGFSLTGNKPNDGIDLERAIDNHEYMTYGGKEIDPEDLELIKRILRNNK